MLTTCIEPGCKTLVMGGRCLEHELAPMQVFVRGRPFVPAPPEDAVGAPGGGAVAAPATLAAPPVLAGRATVPGLTTRV